MASQPPHKPQGLPNPYAKKRLPNPYAAATVASAAPVRYTEEQAKAELLKKATAFHNPHNIKRPQPKKGGPTVKKPVMPAVSLAPSEAAARTQQHSYEWYRSTADDDAAIMEDRRQRNWEEKQRKKEQKRFTKKFGQWNPQAPFRPDRPTNLKAYRASGGYARKKEGFKSFLAAQSRAHKEREYALTSPPAATSDSEPSSYAAKLSFAPPASYDTQVTVPSDQSGDDAYAHRMRLLQQQQQQQTSSPPAPPPPSEPSPKMPPPPPPSATVGYPPPPPPPQPSAPVPASTGYQHGIISAPPVRYANATISAPPVRYEQPDIQMDDADNEPAMEERPAKRAKISKAEAMMAKMGYKKGQGLGKNSDGVVTHLEVKMRKAAQGPSLFDEEGGKIKSQQVWDVRGGMRTQKDEPGRFGEESCVVVTWGCVEGVDWGANADRNDGGIRQEMGEAFSAKFGPVEHVQLDESNDQGVVYIHFKSILSALNAVNRFDEGWEFRGRKIRAKYYDERKFHAGIYDY